MNVKQLKEYLSDLSDDMEVTVDDGHGWLYEIGSVHPTLTKEKGKKKSTSYSADDKIRGSGRMIDDIRLVVRNKRISIQKYSNGAYDHDSGYYEVAHIKLSKSKASFMDDINLEEIKVMLNKSMR